MTDMTKGVYRRIYAGFIDGKRINSVSLAAEAWFWRLMVIADDHGNLRGDAEWLKAHAATRRAELTTNAIESLTKELLDAGLIVAYEVSLESFLNIPDWGTFQPAGKNGRRLRRFPAIGESGGIRVNPGESGGIRKILPSDSDSDSDTDHHHQTSGMVVVDNPRTGDQDAAFAALRRVGIADRVADDLARSHPTTKIIDTIGQIRRDSDSGMKIKSRAALVIHRLQNGTHPPPETS